MAAEYDPREVVKAAIEGEFVVRFYYFSRGAVLQRTVSPYEVADDGDTFLGYDHLRDALRRFEFGKVLDIELADGEDYVRPIEGGN